MDTLIIYAHPETEGHCSYILEQTEKELKRRKVQYTLLDLYRMKYDPVLHREEHYTAGNRKISKQNKDIQKKIERSKHLIFICPIWWGSYPAILKGFFDRVLTSRFAYMHKEGKLVRLLKGKTATVMVTSGGPRALYSLTGNIPRLILKHAVLGYCGIRTRYFQIGSCYRIDDKKKEKIKKMVARALRGLHG
ncbi:NAD(P)H-dependent oxidoreductase [Candidatus Woesearchaeota archaeon]|nr:NAD(P)H-dependent oxidoreductase [Candidatus Woesearchaeota archaeon]